MNLLTGVEQDFHRPQKSPGAYEWWHFDGADDKSGYSFSIQFHAGNLFSAYYQDSLKTYWRKTKSPLVEASSAPDAPNPLDYCGVFFRLFHKGRMVVESLQEFSQKSLKASDKYGAVLLGPNRFNWDERGDPASYVLTVQAPLHGGKTTVRARFFFSPRATTLPGFTDPVDPDSKGKYFSTHTWVLAAPWCRVEGTLEWVNPDGESQREVAFQGAGYHDHHFGTVPLDRFVKAWHWGHARLGEEDLVYLVQILDQKGGTTLDGPELTTLLSTKGSQVRAWNTGVVLSQNRRNFFWLPYQRRLEFPGARHLRLDHRGIHGDGPVQLFLEDTVRWEVDGKTVEGTGFSNYLYTPRLSNRFFFPLLKGKSLIVKPSGDSDSLPPPSGDVSVTRPPI